MERKDTILTACAVAENRKYLRFVLSERFHLLEAQGIPQMLALLEQNMETVVTMVIGTSALENGGQDLLREQYERGSLGAIPVVILNENDDLSLVNAMFQSGAADVIDLHYDSCATLHRIDTVAQLYMHRSHMERLLNERSEILRQSNDTMVDVLSSIIEYRSAESGHHVLRIRNFVRTLLEEVMYRCPEYNLTNRTVNIISSASAMHDVGKISIPDAILTKPGPLTPEEWEIMKTHSATGCQILETLGGMADQEYLRYAKNICRYHHERWDGSGYPDGLVGDQIPICAQVVGLADAYEALTAERSYKQGYSFDQAINMILKGECGAFSPKLLACLKHVTEAYEQMTNAYADGCSLDEGTDMSLPAPDTAVSSLERTQAMYYALIHYINGFLMEVHLDQGLFHVIYNPYPELAQLETISTLGQLVDLMLDQIVVPEERDRMQDLIFKDLPRFVEEDLRRSTHRFHYRELEAGQQGQFEMTFLRNGIHQSKRKSLAILFRKVDTKEDDAGYTAAWYSLAESTYVCRNDQYFTLVSLDHEASGLGGYSRGELFEKYQGRLIGLIHPDDREWVRSEFTRQLKKGTEVRIEHRVCLKNGKTMWVTNKSRMAIGPDGQENLHCFLTDITKTRSEFEDLRQRHDRYIDILTRTDTVLFDWNLETDLMEFSDTMGDVIDQPAEGHFREWLTQGSWVHPDDIPLLMDRIISLENGSDRESQEVRLATDRGRYVWCRIRAHAQRDEKGRLKQVVGSITDVDAEKMKERLLQDRAERDSLTKLLNHDAGRKKITAYLSHYPQGAGCAMLIIDLDDFKQVNDTYGHLFGDAVLSKVAQEIKHRFNGQDIVVRIGGDEFLVLVRGLTDRHLLEQRCQRLLSSFCDSLKAKHPALNMSCSIGIALSPEHGKSYYDLFNHADQALYRAKAKGKNTYCFYDSTKEDAFALGQTSVSRRIDSDEEPGLAEDSIVRHVFKLLYSADDMEAAIQEVIRYIGKEMNVSRVYIFENSEDNRFCSNTYEWCNTGIQPEIGFLQNVSYDEDIPGYLDCFNEQGLIYCADIRELPEAVQRILAPQGIKSMLHCAVHNDGVFRGYIGFDDCEHHRMWTREEIQMLTYFTEVISMFLMKARRQAKIASQAQDLVAILENQDRWIYVIDPDTWQIRYMNRKAREILPHAQLGRPCYEAIHGRSSPCPGCLSMDIRKKGADRQVRRDGEVTLMFESTMIRWEGTDSCMMCGCILPDAQ